MRVSEDSEIISIAKVIKEDEEMEDADFGECGPDENGSDGKNGKAKEKTGDKADGPEQIEIGEIESGETK